MHITKEKFNGKEKLHDLSAEYRERISKVGHRLGEVVMNGIDTAIDIGNVALKSLELKEFAIWEIPDEFDMRPKRRRS